MKKINRLISGLTALTCCLPMITSFSASAKSVVKIISDTEVIYDNQEYLKIDNFKGLLPDLYDPEDETMTYYLSTEGDSIVAVKKFGDYVEFEIPVTGKKDEIEDILNSIDSATKVSISSYTKSIRFRVYFDKLDINVARQIYSDLAEYEITSFETYQDYFHATLYHLPYLTAYYPTHYEMAEEYIKESGLDVEVIKYDSGEIDILGNYARDETYYVVPNQELDLWEHYALNQQIYNATGATAYVFRYNLEEETSTSTYIDIMNSVSGDAGDDGEVKIDDVVSVLLSVADSENYALSPQGEFNADVYNTGDGISVGDALSIQKYLAGAINNLPEQV